jgi:predicted Zn-ribbon and HTH transcriptional regulator
MKNYQCKKCGTVVQGNSIPSSSGCPEASSHSWTNLGDVGDKNYQCKKCGTVVQGNSIPSSSGCPKASSHSWTKL